MAGWRKAVLMPAGARGIGSLMVQCQRAAYAHDGARLLLLLRGARRHACVVMGGTQTRAVWMAAGANPARHR